MHYSMFTFDTFNEILYDRANVKRKALVQHQNHSSLTLKRLIKEKDIRDVNGDLYHLRIHSLRDTRAKEYAKRKTKMTLEKADKAIKELSLSQQKINFNSVSQLSGVSKTFLYKNQEVKQRIEDFRDKKIKELELEHKKFKEQLELLRGKLYEQVQHT